MGVAVISEEQRADYYAERDRYEAMKTLVGKGYRCGECGAPLRIAYRHPDDVLICGEGHVNPATAPKKMAPRHEKSESYQDKKWRQVNMENRYGAERAVTLARYAEQKELARTDAWDIMHTVYPDVPDADLNRAVAICVSYKLNPLMNHLYMVSFNKNIGTKKDPKWTKVWVPILGIGAVRLMASRSGPVSYGIEDTPRIMTSEEQMSRFGEVHDDRMWVIFKVQDPKTGATAVGMGHYRNDEEVRGADKGNTQFNMAAKRAEAQAVSRLRPGEMPGNIDVLDERFINGEYSEVKDPELAPPADPEMGEITPEDTPFDEKPDDKETNPAADKGTGSKEDFARLRGAMETAEWTGHDVLHFANEERQWKLAKNADLTTFQIDNIIEHLKELAAAE